MVKDPAGGADDHGHALAQIAQLDLHGLSPVDGGYAQGPAAAQGVDLFCHLNGQLAGRGQDQGLYLADVRVQQFQQGQAKGRRLARAGLGLGHDVAFPGEHGGDGLDLMGVGSSKPLRDRAWMVNSERPNSEKVVIVIPCGHMPRGQRKYPALEPGPYREADCPRRENKHFENV